MSEVLFGARSAQVLHISLVMIVVRVGAVGCSRVWPSVGMCRHGFCAAVCGLASTIKVYGEVGVARSEVAGDDDDACDCSADVFPSL